MVVAQPRRAHRRPPRRPGHRRRRPRRPASRVEIEWFVGLGTGENEEQIEPEKAVVKAFNDSQDQVELTLTIVDNTEASDTLATRIAAGDSPDIIGPIGIRGLQSFGDQLLDLTPYVTPEDTAGIDPALVDAYKVDGKQIGIPMAVYPSFFYYNKDLFEEAGVAEPPHEVGEQYEGADWNWEAVRELAKKLTVDANGNDATSADFDPANVVQWGLDAQFTENDARAWSTIFGGSGSVVARRRHDGPVARQLEDRPAVLLRRDLEGPHRAELDPGPVPRGRQHLQVRPHRDGCRSPVVHVLRPA